MHLQLKSIRIRQFSRNSNESVLFNRKSSFSNLKKEGDEVFASKKAAWDVNSDLKVTSKKHDHQIYSLNFKKRLLAESMRIGPERADVPETRFSIDDNDDATLDKIAFVRINQKLGNVESGNTCETLLKKTYLAGESSLASRGLREVSPKHNENEFYEAIENRKYQRAILLLGDLADVCNISPGSLVKLWNGCFELKLKCALQQRLLLAHMKLIQKWGDDAGYDLTRPFASFGLKFILENKNWTGEQRSMLPRFIKASLVLSLKYGDICPLSARYITLANIDIITKNIAVCGNSVIYKQLVDAALNHVPYESRLLALLCVRRVFVHSGFPFTYAARVAHTTTIPLLLRVHLYIAAKPSAEFINLCFEKLFREPEAIRALAARKTAFAKLGLELFYYLTEQHFAQFDANFRTSLSKILSGALAANKAVPPALLNYIKQRQTPNTLAYYIADAVENRSELTNMGVTFKYRLKNTSCDVWAQAVLIYLGTFAKHPQNSVMQALSVVQAAGVTVNASFYASIIDFLSDKGFDAAAQKLSSTASDIALEGPSQTLYAAVCRVELGVQSKRPKYWPSVKDLFASYLDKGMNDFGAEFWVEVFSTREPKQSDPELAEFLVWLFGSEVVSPKSKTEALKSLVRYLKPASTTGEFYETLWYMHEPANKQDFVDYCVRHRLFQAGQSFCKFFKDSVVDPRLYIIQSTEANDVFVSYDLICNNLSTLDWGWAREEIIKALLRFSKASANRERVKKAFYDVWRLLESQGFPDSYAQWCRIYQVLADQWMIDECRFVWSRVCAWFNSKEADLQNSLIVSVDWSFMWNARLKAVILSPASTFRDITNTFEAMSLAGVPATEATWVSMIGSCRERPESCDRFWRWLSEREQSKINIRTETARLNNLQFTGRMSEFWEFLHVFVHKHFPSALCPILLEGVPPCSGETLQRIKRLRRPSRSDKELLEEVRGSGYAFFAIWLDAVYHNYPPQQSSAYGKAIMLQKYPAVVRALKESKFGDNVICSFLEGEWKNYKQTSNFVDFVVTLQTLKKLKEFKLGAKSSYFLRTYISQLPSAAFHHKDFVKDYLQND